MEGAGEINIPAEITQQQSHKICLFLRKYSHQKKKKGRGMGGWGGG